MTSEPVITFATISAISKKEVEIPVATLSVPVLFWSKHLVVSYATSPK